MGKQHGPAATCIMLNTQQAACNAYHAGLKERVHISIDSINPDLDIHSTGQAVVQCEMISDCYAQDADNEIQDHAGSRLQCRCLLYLKFKPGPHGPAAAQAQAFGVIAALQAWQ